MIGPPPNVADACMRCLGRNGYNSPHLMLEVQTLGRAVPLWPEELILSHQSVSTTTLSVGFTSCGRPVASGEVFGTSGEVLWKPGDVLGKSGDVLGKSGLRAKSTIREVSCGKFGKVLGSPEKIRKVTGSLTPSQRHTKLVSSLST